MDNCWKTQLTSLSPVVQDILEEMFTKLLYSVIEIISNSSGQGVLLKVFSKKFNREIALKISKDGQKFYNNLNEEYKLISKIEENSNIVRVLDIHQIESYSITIIAQELCQCDLKQEMEQLRLQKKWYSESEMTLIILQLSHALTQIHGYKIIHSDIKPENILKSKDEIYKICDFGYSRKLDAFKTSTVTCKGCTFSYVSPEIDQILELKKPNKDINVSYYSDVYSMGLIFFEILGYPFTKDTNRQILKNKFQKIKNIKEFKYPQIFDLLCNKFFAIDGKQRINSYEIIYELLPLLPQNESQFDYVLSLIEQINQQDVFDNNKCCPFQIQRRLKYNKTRIYIYQQQKASPKLFGNAYSQMGYIYLQLGKLKKSIEYFLLSITQYEQTEECNGDLIKIFYSLSNCYIQINSFDSALIYANKSIELFQNNFNTQDVFYADCLLQKANCFYNLNEFNMALQIAQESHNLYSFIHKDQPNEEVALCLNLIGQIYNRQQYNEISLEYFQKSLEKFEELYANQNNPSISSLLNDIGVCLESNCKLEESLEYFLRSVNMYQFLYGKSHANLIIPYQNIIRVQKKLGHLDQSEKTEQLLKEVEDFLVQQSL